MAGRPDFTTPPTGNQQTISVSDRPKVPNLSRAAEPPVDPGETIGFDFLPPEGAVWELKNIKLTAADTEGTSGSHNIRVFASSGIRVITGKGGPNDEIRFNNSSGQDGTWSPSTEAAQAIAVEKAIATPEQPLRVFYSNNTDSVQDDPITAGISVRERSF